MNEFIYTLIIIFVAVMLAFILFNVKFILKGEEFKKTCSTTGEACTCTSDGSEEVSKCENQID